MIYIFQFLNRFLCIKVMEYIDILIEKFFKKIINRFIGINIYSSIQSIKHFLRNF